MSDPTIDNLDAELVPEPAKPAAISRAGCKKAKRDAKRAKLKTPKPSKAARGQVRR